MDFDHAIAFGIAMTLWTAMPGPGLAVVLSRAIISGRRSGFAAIAGLVVADVIFMACAVIGLMALAEALGPIFLVVKYAGAAYLMWCGYRLIVGAARPTTMVRQASGSVSRDVGLGLLVTLGNPKAVLFFGAILPTFVDMTMVRPGDFVLLTGIVAGVSFAVYGGYMLAAEKARHLVSSAKAIKRLKQAAGTLLIGSGVLVASR